MGPKAACFEGEFSIVISSYSRQRRGTPGNRRLPLLAEKTDIAVVSVNVRFRGKSGHRSLGV
jgi:hypothetical protein